MLAQLAGKQIRGDTYDCMRVVRACVIINAQIFLMQGPVPYWAQRCSRPAGSHVTAPRPPPARTGGGVRRSPSMRPRRWTRTTGRAEVARSVRGSASSESERAVGGAKSRAAACR